MNEIPRLVEQASARLPGMRLMAVEVLNWGTFDKQVWRLDLNGANALLTGDIGSGKSTLVDAITTLIVPAHKISYNKAAGAEMRERDLKSYVLGHFKAERGEAGLSAKAIGLRAPGKAFSVILGRFRNGDFGEDVTLAQVFWFRQATGQPERFFVVASAPLSIRDHFSGFGSDLGALRKRLRKLKGVEIFDSFPGYGAAFRRLFGILNEQALDLFLQTVSMKQVGDLTEFVRSHMLEPFPVEARIAQMLAHFADLTAAHEAVLKARDQIERLTPIVADCDRLAVLDLEVKRLRACRTALAPYFGALKCDLLDRRIADLESNLVRLGERIAKLKVEVGEDEQACDAIKQAIFENGGNRIATLDQQIASKRLVHEERCRRADAYSEPAQELGLQVPRDANRFLANLAEVQRLAEELTARETEVQNREVEVLVPFERLKEDMARIEAEVKSLKSRRSNIPLHMLEIRERLCRAVDVESQHLPFAGELIEVREDEAAWEGAAERLLRPFALSLLVPETHYAAVAQWVDDTHLAGKLVYYKVPRIAAPIRHRSSRDALSEKLRVRDDSPLYAWLTREIDERFSHVCCDNLDRFRREPKAITRFGQTKGHGDRHEKDDRSRIDDRTRYVLGWSNEGKIAALEAESERLANEGHAFAIKIETLRQERRTTGKRLGLARQVAAYRSFNDLDFSSIALDVARLEEERRQLAEGSDILKTLNAQLGEAEVRLAERRSKLEENQREETKQRERQDRDLESRTAAADALQTLPDSERESLFPALDTLRAEVLGEHRVTIEGADAREREMREALTNSIDNEDKRIQRLRDRITGAMRDYANSYPIETREADTSPEAGDEYRQMLATLVSDDLPRFETRFKSLLNENTIREIAGFHAGLRREEQEIRERIATINDSLRNIDYNPGRYIVLEMERTADREILDFQQDLRKCTEGSLWGSEDTAYSEAKFLEVRRIMERLRGRKDLTEIDKRWTRKVTDVRNWFVFSASERYRADDTEHEHYSDSGGKSGGQKEKLAYTVLAASLAYQFGLDPQAERSRAFHFVMIDEAFGRGSDESADFALRLFQSLGLQLLIATPLQKIHVIEPYVAGVGFVHNEDGRRSMLRNLTIEEYRAEQRRRAGVGT